MSIVVFISVGPSSVKIENKQSDVTTIVQGDPYIFYCQSSLSNPPAVITWRLNGELVRTDSASENAFPIGLTYTWRDSHSKILSCEAQNPFTNETVIDSTRLNIICK